MKFLIVVVLLYSLTIVVFSQDQQIQYQNLLIDGPGNVGSGGNQLPQVAVYDTLSGSGVKQQHTHSSSAGNVQGKQYSQASANAVSSGYSYSETPKYKPQPTQSSYAKPQYQPQQPSYSPVKQEESSAYYYQHYPAQHHHSENPYGQEHGMSTHGDGDFLGGFGDFGGALGGIGGLGIAGLAALAKGALAIKPLLIFALLFLLALPLLLIFLPIPIITINRPSGTAGTTRQLLNSAMSTIQEKVLDSEECLERIICKVPALTVPKKYQSTAASLWNEYGSKYISNSRIRRGLDAYFNNNNGESNNKEGKKKISKCNQHFKCSNKYL